MNYEMGPVLMQPDPLRPKFPRKVCNPRYYRAPEIVSMTQILKENYVVEYGQFIRNKFAYGQLEVPYFGRYSRPVIMDVLISEAFYDKLCNSSFAMYVICDVHFYDQVTGQDLYQKYCVTGYHTFYGKSDYLMDVEIYNGKRMYLPDRLDDCLVPYIYKSKYDICAYNFLKEHQPEALEKPCKIDIESLVDALGFKIRVEQLSLNGKIRAKTIFHTKDVTVYVDGKPVKKSIKGGTILVSSKCDPDYLMNLLHECIHIEHHRLFYELQYYYRSFVKMEMPDFDDFFMSRDQQDTLRSMEIQANALTGRIAIYSENLDITIENFRDSQGRDIYNTDLHGYEQLVEHIVSTYGTYRTTAKNRLLHKGFKRVRGVFEWGDRSYAEAHEIPDNFPDDWTYTVPLYEISKIFGKNLMFDQLLFSKKFVYADGHVCIYHTDYVYESNGRYWLTDKAKENMAECCLPFRRVYGKENLKYTFGELNKEEQAHFYEYAFSSEIRAKLDAKREELLKNSLYVEEERNGKIRRRKMTRGEAVIFLMKQADMTEEEVAEAAACSVDALTDLRSDREYKPRLGTMLAFFTALKLDDVYRDELLVMTGLLDQITTEMYQIYLVMRELMPEGFTVHQANQYLRECDKTTWTSVYRPKKKAKKAI